MSEVETASLRCSTIGGTLLGAEVQQQWESIPHGIRQIPESGTGGQRAWGGKHYRLVLQGISNPVSLRQSGPGASHCGSNGDSDVSYGFLAL